MIFSRKSQISIFIIIMIIIILLFVVLFSFQSDVQNEKIDSGEQLAGAQTYNFEALQNELDFCFLNSLEKSLILASGKGGLLYNEQAYQQKYIQGAYFNDYQQGVLDPYDLYLDEVLLLTTPIGAGKIEVNPSDVISPVSSNLMMPGYRTQFQEFILNEVFECVDFEDYLQAGFSIERKQVTTSIITKISSNTLQLEPFEGEDGDELFLEKLDTVYKGVLRINNGEYIGDFSSSSVDFTQDTVFSNYRVINKDVSVYVDLNFEEETVSAIFYFPVVFEETNVQVSSLDVSAEIENRFKGLLQASNQLVEQKLQNRTLDYSNSLDLQQGLQGSISNISVATTKLIDEPELKRYIYSIFDLETQFLGKPLQFQFAYENYAPVLDFTQQALCYKIEGDSCTVLFVPGDLKILDLFDVTVPIEQRDVHNIVFDEVDSRTLRANFTLLKNGTVEFEASQDGIYSYDIVVRDGETYREYTLKFLSGSVDNINNEDASSCFIIENTIGNHQDLFFPIDNEFSGVDNTMKIFDGMNGTKHMPYAYVLGIDYNHYPSYEGVGAYLQNIGLRVSETCVEDPNQYKIIWSDDISGKVVGLTSATYSRDFTDGINLSPYAKYGFGEFINQPYTIRAQVVDLNDNLQGDALEIRIYPSQCLGSGAQDPSGISCCNTSLLLNHKNEAELVTREMFDLTRALNTSRFNVDLFFGIPLDTDGTLEAEVGTITDYSQVNIWDTYGQDITSIYKGEVSGTCGNPYPRWQHNINSISGSSSLGNVARIDSFKSFADNISFDTGSPYQNRKSLVDFNVDDIFISTNTCQFGIVTNYTLLVRYIDNNGEEFQLVGGMNNSGLQPIPNRGVYSSLNVLCNDTWFAKHRANSDQLSLFSHLPITQKNRNIYRTKGFCSQGSYTCGKADPSEGSYLVWEDPITPNTYSGGSCTVTSFDGTELKQESEPASKSSPLQPVGTLNCLNDSNGVIVDQVQLLKKYSCGDTDPSTTEYQCTTFELNVSQSCPFGSTVDHFTPTIGSCS